MLLSFAAMIRAAATRSGLFRMYSTSSAITVPSVMRAVTIENGKGPSSALRIEQVPTPTLSAEDTTPHVLVKVRAFGLNRMDLMQREGQYPIPPGASPIMGVEFSGEVAALPQHGPPNLNLGDAVFGLAHGGAYAEYIRVPASMIWKKDAVMNWEQAAAVPEAYITALQALHTLSNLKKGEDVLIHAGASGVGLAAIQLAKYLGARNVYVTAGTTEKIARCKQLGATDGFNYKTQDWAAELKRVTEGKGVDVIMDFIGAAYFNNNLASLRLDGRMTMQAFLGGIKLPEGVNIAPMLTRRLRIEGSTLRSRTVEYQAQQAHAFERLGCIDALLRGVRGDTSHNALQIILHKVWDWHDIKEAHDYMAANQNTGKMIAMIS